MTDILEKILEEKYPEYAKLPIVDDIHADENPRDDFWSDLTEQDTYDVNAEFLKRTGNPKYDYLTCWEPGRLDDEKEALFDYPTLYEFDLEWWKFQKQAQYDSVEECRQWMEKGSEHWTPEKVANSINSLEEQYKDGYSIYCSGDWFRMIDNGVFLYAQIISAKWYIYYELERTISNLQDDMLPYSLNEEDMSFEELLNEDDPEKKYKADGREKELNTLQEAIRKYEGQPLIDLIDNEISNHSELSGVTFRFDRGYVETETEKFDPFTDFIFWDEQSLKAVRTKHFLEDIKEVSEPNSIMTKIIETLKEAVKKDFMVFYDENKSRYL